MGRPGRVGYMSQGCRFIFIFTKVCLLVSIGNKRARLSLSIVGQCAVRGVFQYRTWRGCGRGYTKSREVIDTKSQQESEGHNINWERNVQTRKGVGKDI